MNVRNAKSVKNATNGKTKVSKNENCLAYDWVA